MKGNDWLWIEQSGCESMEVSCILEMWISCVRSRKQLQLPMDSHTQRASPLWYEITLADLRPKPGKRTGKCRWILTKISQGCFHEDRASGNSLVNLKTAIHHPLYGLNFDKNVKPSQELSSEHVEGNRSRNQKAQVTYNGELLWRCIDHVLLHAGLLLLHQLSQLLLWLLLYYI